MRGFALCKPDPEQKKPTYNGWPTCSLEPADVADGDMLGILGGPLSDGGRPGHSLVIIDLDATDAVQLADNYLPQTGMVEGRPGKPRSHRYYLVPFTSIPDWATSKANQAAPAAKEKKGHAGPFKKQFRHRESQAVVIDFVGTGGQCVCPPSVWVSKDGAQKQLREWEGGEPNEPAVVEFLELWRAVGELASACGATIPDVMPRTALSVPVTKTPDVVDRAKMYLAKMPPAVAGQGGHNATFTAARVAVWGFDLGVDGGFDLLSKEYNPRCEPAWSEKELRHKCEDADRVPFDKPRGYLRDAQRDATSSDNGTPPGEACESPPDEDSPRGFTDTDIGNGRRFVCDHGTDVRYVADWGQWVIWTGLRWETDRSKTQVERLAKETVDRMAQEAAIEVARLNKAIADSGDDEEKDRLSAALKKAKAELTHAKKSADMRSVGRMLQAARSEPAICVPDGGEVFDIRGDLLNCPNGTVELRTGTLRDHRREDYITRLCPTPFEPAAPRSAYLKFLDTVFDGMPAVANYVRAYSGCVVTAEVSDQTLHILHGDGSNGKNVLIDTWKAILGEGEYAHTAAAELLVGDGWDRHPTEKTGLRGARLVVCSETGEDGQLDEPKMKALTGGDTVTARYMRGDFFQFEPTHKLVLLTNNRPRVKGTDHGVWRRLRLVPFRVRFWKDADKELDPEGEYPERFRADPGLGKRLRSTEAAGILADMVAHAVAFYASGGTLNPPREVVAATNDYRADEDIIAQFFAARVRADPDAKVGATELYKEFVAWYAGEGYTQNKVPGRTKFGAAAKRKFHQFKDSSSFYAVRLLPRDGPESEREDGRGESFSRLTLRGM